VKRRTLAVNAKAIGISVALSTAMILPASPALASVDDGFGTHTTDFCALAPDVHGGYIEFVDYGPGAAGDPANNDDYLVVADECRGGWGVTGYAWLNGRFLGSHHDGRGYATQDAWDPFGNVVKGDVIGVKICLQNTGGSAINCLETQHTSADG
jgi:hypothetical protein